MTFLFYPRFFPLVQPLHLEQSPQHEFFPERLSFISFTITPATAATISAPTIMLPQFSAKKSSIILSPSRCFSGFIINYFYGFVKFANYIKPKNYCENHKKFEKVLDIMHKNMIQYRVMIFCIYVVQEVKYLKCHRKECF